MKKTLFKKLLLGVASLKVVLGLGAYVATTNVVHAEVSGSPLLSQRQANPVVDRLAADIRNATQGMSIGSAEYYRAMGRVISGADNVTLPVLASLFNALEMPADQASGFASRFVEEADLGDLWDFQRAVLEDKLASNGQKPAQSIYNAFVEGYEEGPEGYRTNVTGQDLYNRIWNRQRVGNLNELANIEPAAGGDNNETGTGLYNG